MHLPFFSVAAQVTCPFRAVAARCFFVSAVFFARLAMLALHPAHPARAYLGASSTWAGKEVLADAMTPRRSSRFIARTLGSAIVLIVVSSLIDSLTPLECSIEDFFAGHWLAWGTQSP